MSQLHKKPPKAIRRRKCMVVLGLCFGAGSIKKEEDPLSRAIIGEMVLCAAITQPPQDEWRWDKNQSGKNSRFSPALARFLLVPGSPFIAEVATAWSGWGSRTSERMAMSLIGRHLVSHRQHGAILIMRK